MKIFQSDTFFFSFAHFASEEETRKKKKKKKNQRMKREGQAMNDFMHWKWNPAMNSLYWSFLKLASYLFPFFLSFFFGCFHSARLCLSLARNGSWFLWNTETHHFPSPSSFSLSTPNVCVFVFFLKKTPFWRSAAPEATADHGAQLPSFAAGTALVPMCWAYWWRHFPDNPWTCLSATTSPDLWACMTRHSSRRRRRLAAWPPATA